MKLAQDSRIGSGPPMSRTIPRAVALPERMGALKAIMPPQSSRSPRKASISAWLSMMPVEGESSAASAFNAGSSARASAPLSGWRSVTPQARAWASMAASLSVSAGLVATMSLPVRRCGMPRAAQ